VSGVGLRHERQVSVEDFSSMAKRGEKSRIALLVKESSARTHWNDDSVGDKNPKKMKGLSEKPARTALMLRFLGRPPSVATEGKSPGGSGRAGGERRKGRCSGCQDKTETVKKKRWEV